MKGQKTGGRSLGTPNKATREVKDAARKHGPAAIKTLAALMKSADTDAAKISAAKELLDRAYGKATQHVQGSIGFHEDALAALDD